jgi:hypothetical protein
MARPISWLPRLAAIRRSAEGSVRTHYDSPALAQLFQLQPRAAGKLMESLPKVEALGRSRLVPREGLLRFLDGVAEAVDPAAVEAYIKQQRTLQAKLSRKKPRILVRRDVVEGGRLVSLPNSITLDRGRMTVEFQSSLQLVETLAMLVGAIDNDQLEFEQTYCFEVGGKPWNPSAQDLALAEDAAEINRVAAEAAEFLAHRQLHRETTRDTTDNPYLNPPPNDGFLDAYRIPHPPPDTDRDE